MKITKTQLKEIIKEEASKILDEAPNNTEITEEKIDEGVEGLTPENLKIVADVAEHFIKQPEVIAATIGAAGFALINQLADLFKRMPKPPEDEV
tara:strand:- start:974 stop:1255 length:282 start_codon:yes stop_codon:yes gene_type:complete